MTRQDKITADRPLVGNLAGAVSPRAAPATLSEIGAHGPRSVATTPTGEAGAPNLSTCPDCEGTGFFVIGEFHPDDPRSSATWDCDNCRGTGEVEASCQCGEPLDANSFCKACDDYWPDDGLVFVERISPTRIAL